jgi:DNA-binding NarL/FixJ family response regulator
MKERSEARRLLVIAALPARRSYLTQIAPGGRAQVTSCGAISQRTLQTADVFLVDVDSQVVAAAVVRMAQMLPMDAGVVALADNPELAWVRQALRAGVNAILSREVTADEIQLGIEAAEAGLILLHPSSAGQLPFENQIIRNELDSPKEKLTPREQEVLRLVSGGLGNKEIAERLSISEHTVKFHISSVLGKLGSASRTEAVSQGIKQGLIPI